MSACARSATDLPFKFAIPCAATTNMTSERGVGTTFPGVRLQRDPTARLELATQVVERSVAPAHVRPA